MYNIYTPRGPFDQFDPFGRFGQNGLRFRLYLVYICVYSVYWCAPPKYLRTTRKTRKRRRNSHADWSESSAGLQCPALKPCRSRFCATIKTASAQAERLICYCLCIVCPYCKPMYIVYIEIFIYDIRIYKNYKK